MDGLAAVAGPAADSDGSPEFFLEAEALVMTRDDPHSRALWSSDVAGRGDVFDADHFDFDFEPGTQANAGVRFDRLGFEVAGFWIDSWRSGKRFVGTADCCLVDTNPATSFGLDEGSPEDATYVSEIYGMEGNVSYEVVPGATLLGGVRWIQLNEKMKFVSIDFFENNRWTVDNTLIGPQLGARLELLELLYEDESRWSVRADARIAALFNDIENRYQNARGDGPDDPFGSDNDDGAAVSIQAGLSAGYEVFPGATLRLGYQVLWIYGVALAPDQMGRTSQFNTGGRRPMGTRTEDALYHGGTVGFTIAIP